MKKVIMNVFTTTGFALVILAAIEMNSHLTIPFSKTVFEILGANIVINLGLQLMRKIESQYLFLESFLDVVYITIVLVIFGWIFHWFELTQIWTLALMAVVIYVVATFLRMGRVREEINEINKLLEERDKRSKRKNRK